MDCIHCFLISWRCHSSKSVGDSQAIIGHCADHTAMHSLFIGSHKGIFQAQIDILSTQNPPDWARNCAEAMVNHVNYFEHSEFGFGMVQKDEPSFPINTSVLYSSSKYVGDI